MADDDPVDDTPLSPEWSEAYEVTLNTLLTQRGRGARFATIGAATLAAVVGRYRERHVVIVCREPGRHDLLPAVEAIRKQGRAVQIETTGAVDVAVPGTWLTLRMSPSRTTGTLAADLLARVDEVLCTIRWRADLDRAETLFANRPQAVWLRPSAIAETWVQRLCISVASRHHGWRVVQTTRRA